MKKNLVLVLAFIAAMPAMAQKIKLTEGSVAELKGQKSIALEFNYNNIKIGYGKKERTEADYLADRKQKLNEKEAGKGDKWAQGWVTDRKEHYEPRFTELFTKNTQMTVSSSATYTIVFNTTRTEPGFNVGVMRSGAFIDADIAIVETASKKVVAKISLERSPGNAAAGYDFDDGLRIQESYAKAGKELGQFLMKNLR